MTKQRHGGAENLGGLPATRSLVELGQGCFVLVVLASEVLGLLAVLGSKFCRTLSGEDFQEKGSNIQGATGAWPPVLSSCCGPPGQRVRELPRIALGLRGVQMSKMSFCHVD